MAKIINSAGWPEPAATTAAGNTATDTKTRLASTDTHPSDHPKPASGGGGTK